MSDFQQEVRERIAANGREQGLLDAGLSFLCTSAEYRYSYNFAWLGRPIIQYPQDMVAMQELIWNVRPDLIIETGIAHGGSLILSASMLALLDYCDALESQQLLDPAKPKRRVVGVDIDIRAHNRVAIEAHPMANRIDMIQGSSIDPAIVEQVRRHAEGKRDRAGVPRLESHARPRARRTRSLRPAHHRRQLLRGVRYRYRRHACRQLPGPSVGYWQ